MKQYLFLLRELVRRDFQARYAGSLLGFLWSFVQPLWMLLLFTFVFSTVMRISLVGERTESFGIFLFCGLLPWTAINEGVLRASTAVTDNANLVKKLQFPSQILVVAVVLTGLLHEAIAAAIFILVLVVIGEMAWASLPWLLVAVPLQIAMSVGLGLLLASVHVFFRDTAQLLGLVITGWFYFTPIVYPLSLVPWHMEPLLHLNPLTGLVGLYRRAFLGGSGPPVLDIWLLAAFSLGLLIIGAGVFRRLRPAFVDEI